MEYRHYPYDKLHTLTIDEILIYLRKSRQDDPTETVEEVLSRHEMQLQDYAMRVWGAKIPEENLYREIVSGETIDDRPEIKKVLDRVQEPKIKAVMVMDASRLTRGDLLDMGTMVHALRYTHTLCITPVRSYDLEDKYDRRNFEEDLKRGYDYLETVKELLLRGRRASAMQGYWVPSYAPFGYDRKPADGQRDRKFILVANDNAAHVRMIFEWYADGVGVYEISNRLYDLGVEPTRRKKKWAIPSLKNMLRNDAYIGIVRYGETKTIRVYENGKLRKKQVPAPESECIIAKGKHDPIIPLDLWERVQARHGNCDRTNSQNQLSNPLAGLLVCKSCGYMMRRKTQRREKGPRYHCCMNPVCTTKSVYSYELMEALRDALLASCADIEEKIVSGAESSREARAAQLAALEEKMERLREQEDHQYDLLERKEYTPEVFNRRHAKLVKEMDALREAIETARATMPEVIDYDAALIRLHAAIDALDNDEMLPIEKNLLLKAIIARVEYSRDPGSVGNRFTVDVHLLL